MSKVEVMKWLSQYIWNEHFACILLNLNKNEYVIFEPSGRGDACWILGKIGDKNMNNAIFVTNYIEMNNIFPVGEVGEVGEVGDLLFCECEDDSDCVCGFIEKRDNKWEIFGKSMANKCGFVNVTKSVLFLNENSYTSL